jgi:hypothetical protein
MEADWLNPLTWLEVPHIILGGVLVVAGLQYGFTRHVLSFSLPGVLYRHGLHSEPNDLQEGREEGREGGGREGGGQGR